VTATGSGSGTPGRVELAIPRLRQGSSFPHPWSPAGERAMVPVVARADMAGVSTHRVEELVPSLGIEGIGPSLVSAMAKEPDQPMEDFCSRPLDAAPTRRVDRRPGAAPSGGRSGGWSPPSPPGTDGHREILGLDVGAPHRDEFRWGPLHHTEDGASSTASGAGRWPGQWGRVGHRRGSPGARAGDRDGPASCQLAAPPGAPPAQPPHPGAQGGPHAGAPHRGVPIGASSDGVPRDASDGVPELASWVPQVGPDHGPWSARSSIRPAPRRCGSGTSASWGSPRSAPGMRPGSSTSRARPARCHPP